MTWGPEHWHDPVQVTDLSGASVGRWICADCLDECDALIMVTTKDGEECQMQWVREGMWADTVWLRTPDGSVRQLLLGGGLY